MNEEPKETIEQEIRDMVENKATMIKMK